MYVTGNETAILGLDAPAPVPRPRTFPRLVRKFLEQVETNPAKHQRLLLCVAKELNPVPDDTLADILKEIWPAVRKVIDASPDRAGMLRDARRVLELIGEGHRKADAKFAQWFKQLRDLSKRVRGAYMCAVSQLQLLRWYVRMPPRPVDVTRMVREGRNFIHARESQPDFAQLSKEISQSGLPKIIHLMVGFNLNQAMRLHVDDHKDYKDTAKALCPPARRKKSTSPP